MPAPYCYLGRDLRDANSNGPLVDWAPDFLYCFSRWDISPSDTFGTYVYEWTAYDASTEEVMGTGSIERETPFVRPGIRRMGPTTPEGAPPSGDSGVQQQSSKAKGFAIATGLTVLGGGLIALLRR